MPGSVALASVPANRVLPNDCSSGWQESHEWIAERTEPYCDGRDQYRSLCTASRRSWQLSRNLDATKTAALIAFYVARAGRHQPFYFYPDPLDFDATGQSTAGRVTVRFDGALDSSFGMGRSVSNLRLVEIA